MTRVGTEDWRTDPPVKGGQGTTRNLGWAPPRRAHQVKPGSPCPTGGARVDLYQPTRGKLKHATRWFDSRGGSGRLGRHHARQPHRRRLCPGAGALEAHQLLPQHARRARQEHRPGDRQHQGDDGRQLRHQVQRARCPGPGAGSVRRDLEGLDRGRLHLDRLSCRPRAAHDLLLVGAVRTGRQRIRRLDPPRRRQTALRRELRRAQHQGLPVRHRGRRDPRAGSARKSPASTISRA